jgi:6-phosphogluconolactonase
MSANNQSSLQSKRTGSLSRRQLLQTAGGLALASSVRGRAFAKPKGNVLAYVGAYTPNGQGIHQFQVDRSSGALTPLKVFPARSPSWLAIDPSGHFLYCANEISNFNGTTTGSVSGFAIDGSSGDLTLINTVSSGGAGPAHVSVDPLGKYVFVANYGGGNVAVLPRSPNGMLGSAVVQNDAGACAGQCPLGPTHAQNAPPGSFAVSGHDAPHAHMIQATSGGDFVIVNDLGLDLTIVWQLDRANGHLLNPSTTPSSPGAGPRHFAFHPNGTWFYCLNEEASTLAFMTYSAGSLNPVSEVSMLPEGFVGTSFGSEVMVSPDGRFVYATNRLHDTIAIFSVGGAGEPTLIGEEWTRGDYPRHFNIDPTGRFLYVCNQRSDAVTLFNIDGGGSKLKFTGRYTAVGSPAMVTFLSI